MKQRRKWGVVFLLALCLTLGWAGVNTQAAPIEAAGGAGFFGAKQTGWVQKGSTWYYYNTSGAMVKNKWITYKGEKYYLHPNGKMATGWTTIGGKKYFFQGDGVMVTGWLQKGKDWYYFSKASGVMMANRLVKENRTGIYYFFHKDGKMATGLHKAGNYYRYFGPTGAMQTGWQLINGKWYYFNSAGAMLTGRITVSGKDYYMGSNGVMQTGWITKNGKKFYADPVSGAITIGWKTSAKGNKYYFSKTGVMQTGWTKISGKYYYFTSSGIMAKDTWVGDRYVGANGVYIPGYNAGSDMRWPLDAKWNYISSYFGNRDSPGGIGSTNHQGIDIPANGGEKIYAAAAGTIVVRQISSSAGYYIELNHGGSLNTQYMHMSKFKEGLAVGDKVKKGQVIGYVGSTGNSTGNHLHFGVKNGGVYKDPLNYVKQP